MKDEMNYRGKDQNFQQKILQLVLDILLIEVGLMISSFGTSVFYAADLGSSAMATFSDGLHLVLSIDYGVANTVANVVFLVALFLLDRSFINIGTLLCVFTIGPWVDLFTPMLQVMELSASPMAVRVLCSLVGAALMGVGLGLYMAVNRGFGALEGIVKYARNKTGISVRNAKIIQDAVLVALGIILGAQWGIGTVVGIFCTGPVLQRASSAFEIMIRRSRERLFGAAERA